MSDEFVTVAYLARLAGVSENTVWENINLLRPLAASTQGRLEGARSAIEPLEGPPHAEGINEAVDLQKVGMKSGVRQNAAGVSPNETSDEEPS